MKQSVEQKDDAPKVDGSGISKKSLVGSLMEKGDVYYNIQGRSAEEAISSFAKVLRLPKSVDRAALKTALVEREGLGTTAIGEGFAIPHSRKQEAASEESAIMAIGYLDTPLDWGAPDGKPVTTLFLILSAGVQHHLSALSGIACLAGKKEFRSFMAKRPSKKELVEYLKNLSC